MNGIVEVASEWHLLGAVVASVGWTLRVIEKSVPPTEVGASCHSVVKVRIVWVGCPKSGWGDIFVEQARAGADKHGQIVHEFVTDLDTVLEKVGSSHDVVDDVASETKVVGGVDVDGTVEGLVDGAFFDEGATHVAVHVEMDRVSS